MNVFVTFDIVVVVYVSSKFKIHQLAALHDIG